MRIGAGAFRDRSSRWGSTCEAGLPVRDELAQLRALVGRLVQSEQSVTRRREAAEKEPLTAGQCGASGCQPITASMKK